MAISPSVRDRATFQGWLAALPVAPPGATLAARVAPSLRARWPLLATNHQLSNNGLERTRHCTDGASPLNPVLDRPEANWRGSTDTRADAAHPLLA